MEEGPVVSTTCSATASGHAPGISAWPRRLRPTRLRATRGAGEHEGAGAARNRERETLHALGFGGRDDGHLAGDDAQDHQCGHEAARLGLLHCDFLFSWLDPHGWGHYPIRMMCAKNAPT